MLFKLKIRDGFSILFFFFSDSRVNSVINKCPVYTKQENLWFIKDGPLQAGVNL